LVLCIRSGVDVAVPHLELVGECCGLSRDWMSEGLCTRMHIFHHTAATFHSNPIMKHSSYDPPPIDEHFFARPTEPRPLPRIDAPSTAPFPGKSEARPFTSRYTRTTHIIPAAQPRYYATGLTEPVHLPSDTSATRKERNAQLAEALAQKKLATDGGKAVKGLADIPELFNVVDRYVISGNVRQGITLLLLHANGFPRRVRGQPFCDRYSYKTTTRYGNQRLNQFWKINQQTYQSPKCGRSKRSITAMGQC
jgi:hypothetical protein